MNALGMFGLGVLGAWGGSFLTVPVLVFLFRADPAAAVRSALAAGLVRAAWSARGGRMDWRTVIFLGVAALPGALLAPRLSREVFRTLVAAALALAALGWVLLRGKGPPPPVLHLNPMDDGPPGARALRRFKDANGGIHLFRVRPAYPLALSALLGLSCGALGLEGAPLLSGVLALSGMPGLLAGPTAGTALALPALAVLASRSEDLPWEGMVLLAAGTLAGLAIREARSAESRTG